MTKRLEFCRACRDERDEIVTAEFIIWGKLTPPEHLGPRCYDHTAAFVGPLGMNRIDQWAIFDLRPHMAPEGHVAKALDELADEMDRRPRWARVTADDVRSEAAKLRASSTLSLGLRVYRRRPMAEIKTGHTQVTDIRKVTIEISDAPQICTPKGRSPIQPRNGEDQ